MLTTGKTRMGNQEFDPHLPLSSTVRKIFAPLARRRGSPTASVTVQSDFVVGDFVLDRSARSPRNCHITQCIATCRVGASKFFAVSRGLPQPSTPRWPAAPYHAHRTPWSPHSRPLSCPSVYCSFIQPVRCRSRSDGRSHRMLHAQPASQVPETTTRQNAIMKALLTLVAATVLEQRLRMPPPWFRFCRPERCRTASADCSDVEEV